MDIKIIDSPFLHDFRRFFAMLVRIFFIIQIMQQTDHAPGFFLFTVDPAKVAHNSFHSQSVLLQGRGLGVLG